MQNKCRTFCWPPVEGVRRPEQDHLWCMCRGREMHRSGIDRDQEPCLANQCCQGEQIRLPGKIDDFGLVLNRGDVRLLVLRCSARQNEIEIIVSAEPFDYSRPSP